MSAPTQAAVRLVRPGREPVEVDAVLHRADGGPDAPRDPADVGVLVVHGAGGNLDAPMLVALADVVAATGTPALRANLGYRQRRASGAPPRAEASVADLADTLAAAAALLPGRRWVLGGASYGGRVATLLAAEGAAPDGVQLAGLLCASYPLHPPGRPDRLRAAHLPAITVPLLVLQGTADPFGSPQELGPHLAETNATVVAVDGGDHGLHVPRTRSADGATHRVDEVVAGLADPVHRWFGTLDG